MKMLQKKNTVRRKMISKKNQGNEQCWEYDLVQQPGVLFLVFQDIDDYWFLHPRPPARRHPSGGQPLSQLQSVCANCANTDPSLIGHQPVQWPLLSPQTPAPNKCHKYKHTTYTVPAKCVHVHWCCCFDVWRKESTSFMSSPANKAAECFCGAMTIRRPCAGMETRLNKVAPAAIRRWRSGYSRVCTRY